MVVINFIKMQAQGNDFVILDARQHKLPAGTTDWLSRITDRRLGIGCDQLLILHPHAQADCRLQIFNSDASEAKNCGNGLRCVGALLLQETKKKTCQVALSDRIVKLEAGQQGVRVYMGAARMLSPQAQYIDIDMGNPHRVYFETPSTFPKDRNIEIISGEIYAESKGEHLYIDIIERGVGPTLACGSGACAVAVAVWYKEQHNNALTIHMSGGTVLVSGNPQQVILEGTVQHVFSGQYAISP